MYWIIYQVTNKLNGKSYIGQTIQGLELRRSGHHSSAFKARTKYHFHNALRKYGKEAFEWREIDKADSLEELNRLEAYWIGYYDTYENGYNSTKGGDGVRVNEYSRKQRERMSRSKGGRPFLVFDLDGNYVSKELIQNEFSQDNGLSVANVSGALNGRKNSIGGFILFFEDEFDFDKLRYKRSRLRSRRAG